MSKSFHDQIKNFTDKTVRKLDLVTRKIILDVDKSLVLKSPVGDPKNWLHPEAAPPGYVGGRFRANWQLGINEIPNSALDAIDPSGANAIGNVAAKMPFSDVTGKHYYLVNRLPYGPRLEHGWSRQAPAGMVQITVTEFKPIVRAAVQAVRAEAV